VIVLATGLDFEALQLPLHPAASRVRMLAGQTPAHFIAFDLLALGDDYTGRPFSERRAALVDALADSAPRSMSRRSVSSAPSRWRSGGDCSPNCSRW
jgi:ATP-dependent DNA ligase